MLKSSLCDSIDADIPAKGTTTHQSKMQTQVMPIRR